MKTEPVILKRLGPVPFWRGEEKCLDTLRRIYEHAMEDARRRLGKTDAADASKQRMKGL